MSFATSTMGPAERAFIASNVGDAVALPGEYLLPPAGASVPGLPAPTIDLDQGTVEVELMTVNQFSQMFVQMHDLAGALVAMRLHLEAPVPYGQEARSPMGQEAAKSLYALIEMQPALARMVLGKQSTFMGHMGAVLLHGFTLLQVTQAAVRGQVAPSTMPPEPETDNEEPTQ